MNTTTLEAKEAIIELEAHYIGCLLKDSTLIDEAILHGEHFTTQIHRKWIEVIFDFNKQDKILNLTTIRTLDDKTLAILGGRSYMIQMMEAVPSTYVFKKYEEAILTAFYVQEAKDIALDFLHNTSQFEGRKALQGFFEEVMKLETRTVKNDDSFKVKLAQRMMEHLDSPLEGLTGVDTGFKVLNHVLDGWQKKDLIVLGGRPSMGKTAFGLATISKGMLADKEVYPTFISAEMSTGGVADRLIASLGKLNLSSLRNINKYLAHNEKDYDKYLRTTNFLNHCPLEVFEDSTVPAIRARMRKRIKEHPGKKHICVIDFLTQLRPIKPTGNANFDYGEIVLDLKQMAKDLDIPVILLVQLNRQNENRQDKRPNMSDIRDTGTVEQAADIIGFIHREDYYNRNGEQTGIAELIIAKNRQGECGLFNFKFEGATQTFHEIVGK